MKHAVLSAVAAALLAVSSAPVSAQTNPIQVKTLAEVSQGVLPVGPLFWQGAQNSLDTDDFLIRGEDIGFDYVVDGSVSAQTFSGKPTVVRAGEAFAIQSGQARRLTNLDPNGSLYWHIGLGGPTPSRYQLNPILILQSEAIEAGGYGPWTGRLTEIQVSGRATLPAETVAGTRTFFILAGPVNISFGESGATLPAGSTATVPADAAITFVPITGERAVILSADLLLPAVKAGGPVPAIPTLPGPLYDNPSFQLLPSGTFPRGKP